MDLKKEIEIRLKSLKEKGLSRRNIEEKLKYRENYIDQSLSKGGSVRLLKSLDLLISNNETFNIVKKDSNKASSTNLIEDYTHKSLYNLTESNKILAQANQTLANNAVDLTELLKLKLLTPTTVGDPLKMSEAFVEKTRDFLASVVDKFFLNAYKNKDQALRDISIQFLQDVVPEHVKDNLNNEYRSDKQKVNS
jgi:hypothetical protein